METHILFFVAAVAAGLINSLAGGGGLIGGYFGGALTGRVNGTALRVLVMTIGFGLAGYYFLTIYGPSELHFGGE